MFLVKARINWGEFFSGRFLRARAFWISDCISHCVFEGKLMESLKLRKWFHFKISQVPKYPHKRPDWDVMSSACIERIYIYTQDLLRFTFHASASLVTTAHEQEQMLGYFARSKKKLVGKTINENNHNNNTSKIPLSVENKNVETPLEE